MGLPLASLDTLAQLVTTPSGLPQKEVSQDRTLVNRAKAKTITNALILRLIDVKGSPLTKSYWSTFHCATQLEQKGKTITTKFCKNRWCMVCNRIRTAMLIKAYEPELKKLPDPYFVTLTFPNVGAEQLQSEIKGMYEKFNRIKRRLAKRGLKLKGLRKLECTYSMQRQDYHPHYHLILNDVTHAKALVEEWLKEYPTAKAKAQNIKPATEGSLLELMKYFTKVLPSKQDGGGGELRINPIALDTVFQAVRGVRVFQPVGITKHVSEEIEELEKKDYNVADKEYAIWIWEQDCADWLNFMDYEPLTRYEPEPDTLNLISAMMNREPRGETDKSG